MSTFILLSLQKGQLHGFCFNIGFDLLFVKPQKFTNIFSIIHFRAPLR